MLREGEAINRTISHVRRIDRNRIAEIIVSDGSPDGQTLQAVTDREVIPVLSPAGRGTQMNRGAARATGEILLFLHADTLLPDSALPRVLHVMDRTPTGAGAFRLGIDSPLRVFRVIEWGASIRCRLSRVPFGDQAIFMKRSYFEEIGGYREIPLMEDIDLMKRIRARGDRVVLLPERVRTSPRRWEEEGTVRCVVRNWILQILYAAGVAPEKLAPYYRTSPSKDR